jgi:hypothetical protein
MLTGLRWRIGLVVKKYGEGITSDGKRTVAAAIHLKASLRLMGITAPWRLYHFNRAAKQATKP